MEKKKQKEELSCTKVWNSSGKRKHLFDGYVLPQSAQKGEPATGPAAAKASQWDEEEFEDENSTSWED